MKKYNYSNIQKLLNKNSVYLYLKEVEKIPLLTREEETELAKKAKNGDKKAKEKLIISNLRFVISVAKKYQNMGLPLLDLISEGNLGLIEAVNRFDPDKNIHFISYAIWWIKQAITKAISEKSRMIRLPMNRNHDLHNIRKFIEDYKVKKGENPTNEIIAKEFEMDKNEVKKILDLGQSHTSLEEINMTENRNAEEVIVDDYKSYENHPEDYVMRKNLSEKVIDMLQNLPERERSIIEYRFGFNGNDPHSLSEIGEKLNLTKERIRQIEKVILTSLKEEVENQKLAVYLA